MTLKPEAKASKRRRQPVARHGVLECANPFLQILTVLGAIVAVVAISVGAVGTFALWDASRAVADNSVALCEVSSDAQVLRRSVRSRAA